MSDMHDKKVLVLGLGETGCSLLRWLSAKGAVVRAADSRDFPPTLDKLKQQFPQVEFRCGVFRSELLDGIELIAASPGVSLKEPLLVKAAERHIPIIGDVELLALQLEEVRARNPEGIKNPVVIAITGVNGKTTVTSMVGAMCRAAGLDTVVAGNISPAVLDALMAREEKQPDIWVLELSSFQLETTWHLSADAASVLNISEDHLDRYADMGEYIAAKARVFRSSGSHPGVQVLNRDDVISSSMALSGRWVVTFGLDKPASESDWGIEVDGADTWLVQGEQRIIKASEMALVGMHNVANALAALALCRAVGLPLRPLLNALRDFKGLPHRVEPVAKIRGVTWYDDSKGTNVGATVAALNGLGCPSVLIAGGDGKGQDFRPLADAVVTHARAVVLIGRDANLIGEVLKDTGILLMHAVDMPEAVRIASDLAKPGDAVLLSPACASFDMFRNYEHRAQVFIEAVRVLQAQEVRA